MASYGGNRGNSSGGNRGEYGGNRGDPGGSSGGQLTFPRDHADSAASPLLSDALVTTRDAITGYWKGDKTVAATADDLQRKLGSGVDYLAQVRMPYRALVLECMLKGAVGVRGKDGQATLVAEGKDITTIHRPSPAYFEKSLPWIRAYADLRNDRVGEIHVQLDDMLSFFGALGQLDTGRRNYSLLLLNVARKLAIHVETLMKYHCPAPRPLDYAMEVQPMIQTPDHSTYPSGHAMEVFAIATVLHRLSAREDAWTGIAGQALPFRLAHRIAVNRTVAGVHFPADSLAGAWVGCFLGELIHALATGGKVTVGDLPRFELKNEAGTVAEDDPDTARQPDDFLLSNFPALATGSGEGSAFTRNPVAEELWNRAAKEWP